MAQTFTQNGAGSASPKREKRGAEMSEAEEWRGHIAELRQVAEQAVDTERQQRLLDLAERWEEYARQLEEPNAFQRARASTG